MNTSALLWDAKLSKKGPTALGILLHHHDHRDFETDVHNKPK